MICIWVVIINKSFIQNRVYEYQAIYENNKIPSRHCFMVFDMNYFERKKWPHCYSKKTVYHCYTWILSLFAPNNKPNVNTKGMKITFIWHQYVISVIVSVVLFYYIQINKIFNSCHFDEIVNTKYFCLNYALSLWIRQYKPRKTIKSGHKYDHSTWIRRWISIRYSDKRYLFIHWINFRNLIFLKELRR